MKRKRIERDSYESDAIYFDNPEYIDIDDIFEVLVRMKKQYGEDAIINPQRRSVTHFELESLESFAERKERAEIRERATYEKLKAKFEK